MMLIMMMMMTLTHFPLSSNMGTVSKGFDARLANNRPFLVFDFRALWRSIKIQKLRPSVIQPGIEYLNYRVAIFGNTGLKWVKVYYKNKTGSFHFVFLIKVTALKQHIYISQRPFVSYKCKSYLL